MTYTVTVDTLGQTYTAEGGTVNEALDNLGLNYTHIKGKGTITLSDGKKEASKLYYLPALRRIVANKLRKAQVAKDLTYLLK